MDPATKQQLTELINRPGLGNKVCADCSAQNPQWCSLSFAVFICLSCAGIHRGFGVHISFVRSVSMDSFSGEQLRRMMLGGNTSFHNFLVSYVPADLSGYSDGMSIHDKYHCWAAAQYRDKLTATLADREWAPSAPEAASGRDIPVSDSVSPQSLRKSRVSGRANLADRQSPGLAPDTSDSSDAYSDRKGTNETFFESLGSINASRPADLAPSQGGRYAGFGNTPEPEPSSSSHPSFGLSSAAAPTFADLQTDPVAALGKGWSLFSSAVVGASRTVNSTVIQPTVERVSDPSFRAGVTQYVSDHAKNANAWSKSQLGVDVGSAVGKITGSATGAGRGTYSSIGEGYGHQGFDDDEGTSALPDAYDDDFFHQSRQNSASFSETHKAQPPKTAGAQSDVVAKKKGRLG